MQQTLFGFAAAWNPKAALWYNGRKHWRKNVRVQIDPAKKRIWIHVASLGEFEQARPVIEQLKSRYPDKELLLTFFSPSGYELRKNYELADHVFYLPADLPRNANDFIELVNPSLVVFIKYEFWFNYLYLLHKKGVPILLVSAAFMRDHAFFQWWGGFFRRMLGYYDILFVQDEHNKKLLEEIGIAERVVVAGDTRYDRVLSIASSARKMQEIETFRHQHSLIIAGSTWPEDEILLKEWLNHLPENWKMIIAPHEVDRSHISEIMKLFEGSYVLHSVLDSLPDISHYRVLIVDNIGMLSGLYSYGDMAYVGGGFRKRGLHNILEPAAFGLPILIGPEFSNFMEAIRFVDQKFAFPIRTASAAQEIFSELTADQKRLSQLKASIRSFMQQQSGATETVLRYIESRKWLE